MALCAYDIQSCELACNVLKDYDDGGHDDSISFSHLETIS